METCAMCNGPLMLLGVLGSVNCLRCRNCGLECIERIERPEDCGQALDNERGRKRGKARR